MLLVACASLLVNGFSPISEASARLHAWQARFESMEVAFRSLGNSKHSYVLSSMPGREGLSVDGAPSESYIDGTFERLLNTSPKRVVSIAYGSPMEVFTRAGRSGTHGVLTELGATFVGEIGCGDAFDQATNKSVSFLADGGLTARFSSQLEPGYIVNIDILWRHYSYIPSRFIMRSPGFVITRELTPAGGGRIWPLTLSQQVIQTHSGKQGRDDLLIEEPTPVRSATPILEAKPGDEVVDENLQLRYQFGDAAPLDEDRATKTLQAVARQIQVRSSGGREPWCGADSLYYLLALVGSPTKESLIQQYLPESPVRGASFLDMQVAASAVGVQLEGYRMSVSELRRRSKPAILACRPSHFMVFVPSGGRCVLIDPPYSTWIIDFESLPLLWTGDVLMEPLE